VAGGLAALALPRQKRQGLLIVVLGILAVGHALFPYAGWLVVAMAMNIVFGACRAVGAVLTQSAILRMVPQHLMGRIQSAFALIATILQIVVSFALGWLAEHTSLEVAFALLGLLYGMAAVAAVRASAVEVAKTSSSVPG
jgi:predicted MFS family arabinose efflux permease